MIAIANQTMLDNTTYDYFKSTKSIHMVDYLWTDYWTEEDFNDYTHFQELVN